MLENNFQRGYPGGYVLLPADKEYYAKVYFNCISKMLYICSAWMGSVVQLT